MAFLRLRRIKNSAEYTALNIQPNRLIISKISKTVNGIGAYSAVYIIIKCKVCVNLQIAKPAETGYNILRKQEGWYR